MATIGNYEIGDLIGEGGFGRVYRGYHGALKREVAIKVCTIQENDFRLRFLREAELSAALRHPNIVTVYDFGESDGFPYLVQEYLAGQDLDDIIRQGDPLLVEWKLWLLVQIVHGLAYAHSKGVIHRDIKPSNIRVLPDGQVRILDFGIAKLMNDEQHLTQTGVAIGTAAYLSPEQFRGERIDHRADMFSFGVLAYQLLTGVLPFAGETISALYYQIAHEEPQPIEPMRPECPANLARIVMRCLEKEPANRFPDCAELHRALNALFGEEIPNPYRPTADMPARPVSIVLALNEASLPDQTKEDAKAIALQAQPGAFPRVSRYGGATATIVAASFWFAARSGHSSREHRDPVVTESIAMPQSVSRDTAAARQTPDSGLHTDKSKIAKPGALARPTPVSRSEKRDTPSTPSTHLKGAPPLGSSPLRTRSVIEAERTSVAMDVRAPAGDDASLTNHAKTAVDTQLNDYLSASSLGAATPIEAPTSTNNAIAVAQITTAAKQRSASLAIDVVVSVVPQEEMLGMKSALCTLEIRVYEVATRRVIAVVVEREPGPGASIEMATDRAIRACVNKAGNDLVARLRDR